MTDAEGGGVCNGETRVKGGEEGKEGDDIGVSEGARSFCGPRVNGTTKIETTKETDLIREREREKLCLRA